MGEAMVIYCGIQNCQTKANTAMFCDYPMNKVLRGKDFTFKTISLKFKTHFWQDESFNLI